MRDQSAVSCAHGIGSLVVIAIGLRGESVFPHTLRSEPSKSVRTIDGKRAFQLSVPSANFGSSKCCMTPEYSVTMRIIAGPVVWPLGSAPTCPVRPAAIFAAEDLPVPWSPVM